MAGMNDVSMKPAIVVLGTGALPVARHLRAALPGSVIHGLASRIDDADVRFEAFGPHLRELHGQGTPIIALCAAGIVIRALAPRLAEAGKTDDPPVLAIAEDGSAVVPLLGGLTGANELARQLGDVLGIAAAITTSGELRFGTCLLHPPPGYVLADLEQGKHFVADLLAGNDTRIDGDAPWLDHVALPRGTDSGHVIRVTAERGPGSSTELRIHPRSVAIAVADPDELDAAIVQAFAEHGLALAALAAIVAPTAWMSRKTLHQTAARFDAALRFVDVDEHSDPATWLDRLNDTPHRRLGDRTRAIVVAERPLDVAVLGRARGSVAVIGLGPGRADYMIPAARDALQRADDILGYVPYVAMAGPLRPGQVAYPSDNREELQRARHAFELAMQGRRVAIVSSGDPGIFAMAAAVLEALEQGQAAWHDVELQIYPGVSAAMATAAIAGAPLGHDFCLISLSDNLKPWDVIEKRLRLAAEADLVMGFYNPMSKHRPHQLERAIAILRDYRGGDTPVVLGRDIGRPGEMLLTLALRDLRIDQVDTRTTVIVGSSTTRRLARPGGGEWVYTPRWYPAPG